MKSVLAFAFALLFLASTPTTADARSGPTEWREVLVLMGPSDISISGQNMAVCQLVGQHQFLMLPILVEFEGYALSSSNCEGDSYFPWTTEELIDAQNAGLIGPELVFDESLSLNHMLINVATIGGLGLLVVGGIFGALFKAFGVGRKKRIRNPQLNEAALAAMCTVARADGRIDAQEAQVIVAVSAPIIGFKPKVEKIIEMLHHAPSTYSEINFVGFAEGLSVKQKRIVMYGALRVAVSDGSIAEEEHRVINGLASALGISGDEMRRMLTDIANPKHIRKAGASRNRYAHLEGRYGQPEPVHGRMGHDDGGLFEVSGFVGGLVGALLRR